MRGFFTRGGQFGAIGTKSSRGSTRLPRAPVLSEADPKRCASRAADARLRWALASRVCGDWHRSEQKQGWLREENGTRPLGRLTSRAATPVPAGAQALNTTPAPAGAQMLKTRSLRRRRACVPSRAPGRAPHARTGCGRRPTAAWSTAEAAAHTAPAGRQLASMHRGHSALTQR